MVAAALSSSSAVADQSFEKAGYNFINIISPPTDSFARQIAEQLKTTMVPTAKDAEWRFRAGSLLGLAWVSASTKAVKVLVSAN